MESAPQTPLAHLTVVEQQVAEIKKRKGRGEPVDNDLLAELESRLVDLTREVFQHLAPPETVTIARHPSRPHTQYYSRTVFSDFQELHGDGINSDDPAIIGGIARLGEQWVTVIGHEKGANPAERGKRNSGSAGPGGYRKAQRIMRLSAKFNRPVITLIDTLAADPSLNAEEEGISRAIAESIQLLFTLPVPVIAVITGEGGSGGALALGVGNRVLMLQHAIYSVIPPEGCANILWKDQARAPEASHALQLTAPSAMKWGAIHEIVPEPPGSAYRDPMVMAQTLKERLAHHLRELMALSPEGLLDDRYRHFRDLGEFGSLT